MVGCRDILIFSHTVVVGLGAVGRVCGRGVPAAVVSDGGCESLVGVGGFTAVGRKGSGTEGEAAARVDGWRADQRVVGRDLTSPPSKRIRGPTSAAFSGSQAAAPAKFRYAHCLMCLPR